MHPPPATVHPEKMLKAKVLSQTRVQDLHRDHHVPAMRSPTFHCTKGAQFTENTTQILAAEIDDLLPPALCTNLGTAAAVANIIIVGQVNVKDQFSFLRNQFHMTK